MNEEAIVYISVANAGEEVTEDFSYRVFLNPNAYTPAEETITLSGEDAHQIRDAFLQRGISEFYEKLSQFYQSFKERRFLSVRYLIISPTYEPIGAGITLELADAIRKFHNQVSQMPCEIEGFLILPGISVPSEQKALCYELMTKLDDSAPAPFDFIYLLDPDYMKPNYALTETIRLYTATNVYKQDRALCRSVLCNRFNNSPSAYSSIGISKLVFLKELWIELLSLKLLKDILLKSRLSPLTAILEVATSAIYAIGIFLEGTSLPKIIKSASLYNRLEGIGEAIRGLKESTEDVYKVIEDFFRKIEYATTQTTARTLEKDDVKQWISEFAKEVRKKTEDVMDTYDHGPFSSMAFLTLILDTDGPYTNLLRKLEQSREDLPLPINLPGYLIGWIAGNPSENLKIIFREMSAEVKRIYYAHQVPIPEIKSWIALWDELERMESSPQFETLLRGDTARISELKEAAEIVKQSFENPYTAPLTPEKVRQVLSVFESRSAGNLGNIIKEMRSLDERLKQVETLIKGFKWWKKLLPKYWFLLRERNNVKRRLEFARKGLEAEANAIIEKSQRLLLCHTFISIYKKLDDELKSLEEEVRGFTVTLNIETINVEEQMTELDFPSDAITHQIAHKDEKDIDALYRTNPATNDINSMFEEQFLKNLKPSKLSGFYQGNKRTVFLDMLRLFARSRFFHLRDWSAEKLMFHLNKETERMATLRYSCQPFIGMRKIRLLPELQLMESLYVGVHDEGETKLSSTSLPSGSMRFYSTGGTSEIIALRLCHGFTWSLVEGAEEWRKCYEGRQISLR